YGDLGQADVGLVGEEGVAQPVVPPGRVEEAVVRRRLVVVPHVGGGGAEGRVLVDHRREGDVGDAGGGGAGDRGSRGGADGAEAVDQVVGRVQPAVVPEDAEVAAVGGHGQGRHPLVVGGRVVVEPQRLAPGRAAVGGLGEEGVAAVGRPIGLVV